MSAGPGTSPDAEEEPAAMGDGPAQRRELCRRALAGRAGRVFSGGGAVGGGPAYRPLPQQGRAFGKGIGPNKASGHKGGMGRQGSKRG